MAIKIHSTPSFGWEVQPEAPCHKILWHVKEPWVAWLRYYISKIQGHFLPSFCITTRCLWCNQRALVDESGVLELRWGHNTVDQKWPQCVCVRRFVRHQPVKVTCNQCICVDMFELYDSPLTLKSFVYFTVQLYCINSFLMKELIELVRLSAVIQSLWHLNLGLVWHAVFIYMKR
jgi:hypothetical protein